MQKQEITNIINNQKSFYNNFETHKLNYRINQLQKLISALNKYEEEIILALSKDLGRCDIDSYIGDIVVLKSSIKGYLKNIKKWSKPKKVKSIPGTKSYIQPEPLGCALIISPWNYPLSLALDPLAAAIASGNCVILKPSEISSNTTAIIKKIIEEVFSQEFVAVIEGGVDETQLLLEQKFDHIFFTGSTAVGKIVYEAAAKNLTPVTLELGGKSPCIVDKNIDLKKSAKRIVYGKFFNCGQTCIAPDYLLVNKEIKSKLLAELKKTIAEFYTNNPQKSKFYSRIINKKSFDRLNNYIKVEEIISGGSVDEKDLYIEPTLLNINSLDSKIMQEEIFGPILPIIEYEKIDDAIKFINSKPKPLALYIFSKDKGVYNKVMAETSSGGACINDTLMHVASDSLPFGGVGESGIGRYHGKSSFDTFSNYKSILKNTFFFDRELLYPPYKFTIKTLKRIVNLIF